MNKMISRILPLYANTSMKDMHKTTQVISFTLPKETLEKLDKACGDIPRSRYLLRMIEKDLK